jgi:hypothetical protein
VLPNNKLTADIAHLTLKDVVDDTSEPKTDTVIKCTKADEKENEEAILTTSKTNTNEKQLGATVTTSSPTTTNISSARLTETNVNK